MRPFCLFNSLRKFAYSEFPAPSLREPVFIRQKHSAQHQKAPPRARELAAEPNEGE